MAKRYNITTKKTYTKDGQEKSQWNTVGSLVKFEATSDKPESYILELNMFPNEKYFVFEQKPKEQSQSTQLPATSTTGTNGDYPADDINPEDIPF